MTITSVRPGGPSPSYSDDDGPPPRGRLANRHLLLTAAAVALVGALIVWLIAFSPVLGAKHVTVTGLTSLSTTTVTDTARVPIGRPLVRLDTAEIARRVESIPQVESARVRVSFPQTVIITVVERRPVGYVVSGAAYALVDKTGAQYLGTVHRPRNLPLFAIPTGSQSRATGQAIAAVAASLDPALLARVASIQAFDASTVTLLLTDQRVVRWGSANRSADKARILPALLTRPGTQFDVSDPDLVVAR